MKRTNLFNLAPTSEQHRILQGLAVNCAKLWNEINHLHRQQYSDYVKLDWNPQAYKRYVPRIVSATAQQVVRKNNEAWRAFLALKRMEKNGKLPSTIKRVKPPGYWKRDGRYMLRILFRCDSYHMRNGCVDLPRGLSIPFKGKLKWAGKQGRLEVAWDTLSKKWRVFQVVHVKPIITPLGSKTCYIDLGVRNLATIWLPEWRQPVAYQSGRLLADWWYWTNRIAQHQQRLATVNERRKSKQLSKLYRTRRKRFRHAVATFARQLVKDLYARGVSSIVIGELTGIRNNNNHGRQGNAMVHNYWSHKYVADRLKWTAEEYGMKIRTVSEAYTSQTCPRCGSRHSLHVLRRFHCLDCGLEAHRDAVGVLNIAARCGGYAVRPMAWPMLLRWDGCRWNRNNGMPTLERSRVEA
ncbi:MAG: transposase [Candidatus Bathyarchaeia archaeon]